MNRFRLQDGVSLVELLMTITVLAIAAAIIVGPNVIKAGNSADESSMPGLLDRASATTQDYFAGSGNPTGSGTMSGFAQSASSIDSRINWASPTSSQLTTSPKNLVSGTVYVVSAADNSVTLCTASAKGSVVVCLDDNGSSKGYFASTSSMDVAASKAAGSTKCSSPGQALTRRNSGC